jgi:hypothetical protein
MGAQGIASSGLGFEVWGEGGRGEGESLGEVIGEINRNDEVARPEVPIVPIVLIVPT